MLSFFIVGCVFLQFINVSDAAGMKCVIMLENSEQRGKITEACTKSNKIDEAKLKDFNINTAFEEFDLDDNCFTQCVYKGFNVVFFILKLTDDGQVNKKETDNLFKGNMTDVMFKKVTSIWTSCIDDVEKMAKDKTNKCKVLALHDFCFNKRMLDDKVHEMEC
ncbi:hypothetical protein Ocin01_10853 [Orchesella cincta]|uniref:Uncharacterized protein n=1 Tax=Orchesella cincta TaxID=48709 RepID=A0A1D2MSF9_ORCCI|nr:hypothetical protein Ocin01_10853 [Orchesella cincta]